MSLTGCSRDPVDLAEELMADYNYTAALQILQETPEPARGESHYRRALGKALLVEGFTAQGLNTLGVTAGRDGDRLEPAAAADVILDAVQVIIREKSRAGEAVRLLKRCLELDAGMRQQALELAWKRGVEYLSAAGDAGLKLMAFTAAHDPQAPSRLRAGFPVLAKRYDEMRAVQDILDKAVGGGNRPAEDIRREGWKFNVVTRGDGSAVATAAALPRNPAGVVPGTVLKATTAG